MGKVTKIIIVVLNHQKEKIMDHPSPVKNLPTQRSLSILLGSHNPKPKVQQIPTSQDNNHPYKTPGITAFLFPTCSLPNFSTYHLLPAKALGNMVATSLHKKLLAGTHPQPPTTQ